MPFSSLPLALVLATIFVREHTLALSFTRMETTSILKPQFSVLTHPMSSETVLMVVLKFSFVLIAILEKKGALA
jgi:uncharacterized membrane protein